MENEQQDSSTIDRKEQLLTIALQMFAQQGYHKTKISDIVAAAGVSQGTFYWHFKSKEAIAMEMIQTGREQILSVISKGYRSNSGTVQDSVQASKELFEQLFFFAENNRYFMELLFRGIRSERILQKMIDQTRFDIERSFSKNIQRAIELGILPAAKDPALQAALLMGLVEGIIARWLFNNQESSAAIQEMTAKELASEIVRFEFFGLLGI